MRTSLFIVPVLVYASLAFADEGGLRDKSSGILTKPSNYTVKETMDRLEAAVKGIGGRVFTRLDYQELSRSAGVDIRPNQLLIFGRGRGGPLIIKEAPLAGIDLPFKALAWEDSRGQVWLSYTNGSYIDKRYVVKGAADSVRDYDEIVEKIVGQALK
jgi:uncharacterized protein (DUF302 family)